MHRQGTLLIEALVSILILSVALTLIMQSLTANRRAMARSTSFSAASLALENQMDFLISKSLRHESIKDEMLSNPDGIYQFLFFETPFDPSDPTSILQNAKLTIVWQNGRNKSQISVDTYLPEFSDHEK